MAVLHLIGTGKPEAKTLTGQLAGNVNAWALYKYDTTVGYVEIFTGASFTGERVIIFPNRFPIDSLVPMKSETNKWYLNDRIRSMRWTSLDSTVYFTFYRNDDGTGFSFNDVGGRTSSMDEAKQIADLNTYKDMTNRISAFRWNMINPIAIFAKPLPIPDANIKVKQKALKKTTIVENPNGANLEVQIRLEQTWTKMSSVTASKEVTKAWSLEVEFGVESSYGGTTASLSVTRSTSGSVTNTLTTTSTQSEEIKISEQHVAQISTAGKFQISASIDLADVSPTTLAFPAVKVFDFPVVGGVSCGTGLWNRTETLYASVSGSFRSDSKLTVVKLS